MKSMNYSLVRIVCALLIGLVLVVWPDAAVQYIVRIIGILFLIPGCIVLIGYFGTKQEPGVPRRFPIEGVGSLLFGLWLVIMPDFFTGILMFLLGFILVLGGVQQIASLAAARRWMPVPIGFYVVPVLILIAGIISLFNPSGVFMIIGISSIVYALSDLLNWFKFSRRRQKMPSKEDSNIEDAEIIE